MEDEDVVLRVTPDGVGKVEPVVESKVVDEPVDVVRVPEPIPKRGLFGWRRFFFGLTWFMLGFWVGVIVFANWG